MSEKVDEGILLLPYRKAFEAVAAAFWFCLMFVPFLMNQDSELARFTIVASLFCFCMFFYNAVKTFTIWQWRVRLFGGTLLFLSVEDAKEKYSKHPDYLYLGEGFDWDNQHTQLAYDLMKKDFNDIYPPQWFVTQYNKIFKTSYHFAGHHDEYTDKVRGLHWIHGIGLANRKDLYMPFEDVKGNVGISGTTRSGKTRCYDNILAQLIMQPKLHPIIHGNSNTILVIDPKGDDDLQQRVIYWAEQAGRIDDLFIFDPAKASKSCRLDCMSSFSSGSDLASRISPMIKSDDSFSAFVWNALETYASGMLYLGIKPSISLFRYYVEKGPDELLFNSIKKLSGLSDAAWDSKIESYSKIVKTGPRISGSAQIRASVEYYKSELQHAYKNGTIDGLLSMFDKERTWTSKMIASGEPILRSLCAGDLEQLLSPDPYNIDDLRPIVDLEMVVRLKKILYVRLNSMGNTEVAGNIGSLILSDLTFMLQQRYSYNQSGDHDVYLLVDESSNVFNEPFIDALNKGAGAGLRSFIAFQTTSDVEARLGDQAKSEQILGNLNNSISTRTVHKATTEYVSDLFQTTTVIVPDDRLMTSARGKDEDLIRHSGSYGTTGTSTEAPVISPQVLNGLADLQFVGMISAGRRIKGVIPIINVPEDVKNYTLDRLPYVQNIKLQEQAV